MSEQPKDKLHRINEKKMGNDSNSVIVRISVNEGLRGPSSPILSDDSLEAKTDDNSFVWNAMLYRVLIGIDYLHYFHGYGPI